MSGYIIKGYVNAQGGMSMDGIRGDAKPFIIEITYFCSCHS